MDDSSGQSLLSLLTARELEIFRLVLAGLSNQAIADELVLASETVRWYTKQIYSKLGVHGRVEAITRARDAGWFDAPESSNRSDVQQLSAPRHNLPGQLTPLVGRKAEIAAVKRLLQRSRLLTLTGPGGIGKTRLAIQTASEVMRDFADGVCFVTLAPTNDPALVVNAIAQTLEVSEVGGRSLAESLANFLHEKHMLVVLDNFEQVIQAAPLVSELLAAAPRLKIIVTSREVLHLYGEYEYSVPPLSVPDRQQIRSATGLAQNEAVALFIQRAEAARPDFKIDEDNAPTIAEICIRLDGLPLALELAAARVKLFTPQALLDKLSNHTSLLPTLTGGARDVPARQQTLRGTIDWSYDLLDENEKTLLTRLAVFSGGCTLEAAEAVCGENLPHVATDGLESLVNKSLLRWTEGQGGQPRFTMLETIREYALEKLDASGQEDALRRGHAHYFMTLAEQSEPYFYGQRMHLAWFGRLEAERDNFRMALHWSVTQRETETGLRIATALGGYWDVGDYWSEEFQWLATLLALADDAPTSLRAKALWWAGELSFYLLNHEDTTRWLEESLTLALESGDRQTAAWALGTLGLQAMIQVDFSRSFRLLDEALAIFRELRDEPGLSQTLRRLGMTAAASGDYQRAAVWLDEALLVARAANDKAALGWVFYTFGYLAWFDRNDPHEARSLTEESLALFREDRNRLGVDDALLRLGEMARIQGDVTRARNFYRESLTLAHKLNYKLGIAHGLNGLGALAGIGGQWRSAARHFGAANALRELIGPTSDATYGPTADLTTLGGVDQEIANARASLGEAAFAAAWAEGRAMTPEQAAAYALSEGEDPA